MNPNCPYCNAEIEICHDDGYGYEEEETFEQQCDECEKTFAFTTSISFHYKTNQADCLNGAAHKFEPVIFAGNGIKSWDRCKDCGHEKKVYKPDEETIKE